MNGWVRVRFSSSSAILVSIKCNKRRCDVYLHEYICLAVSRSFFVLYVAPVQRRKRHRDREMQSERVQREKEEKKGKKKREGNKKKKTR